MDTGALERGHRAGTLAGLDATAVRGLRLRTLALAALFAPVFVALLVRAAQLQLDQGDKLGRMAKEQYLREVALPPKRGPIFDRRGVTLATSIEVDSIYVDPVELGDSVKALIKLAGAAGADRAQLRQRLSRQTRFAWVKRRASPAEVAAVKALELPGVGFIKEARRFYPERELAAPCLGFAGVDGHGLGGVELAFDEVLRGKPQSMAGLRDAHGRGLLSEGALDQSDSEGAAVTLTLDHTIQYIAEKALITAVERAQAKAGTAVVMDPATGEILALASAPSFNPNDVSGSEPEALRDRAVSDAFEPGSTMKVFLLAQALEARAIKPLDVVFAENGSWDIGAHTIHDHHPYGWLSPGRVIQVSSNIGAAKIGLALGRQRLHEGYRAFGFGEKPGLGLPGETGGKLVPPRSDIAVATYSFGQGLTASAIQLAAALSAVANGGTLMRPYLVAQVADRQGNVLLKNEPQIVRAAISPETARRVARMMELVVQEGGTATLAAMPSFRVAGKTGTAQKVDPIEGGYSVDKRTASFMGFVPSEAPRMAAIVVIDEPKKDIYGGLVAAPAFREIAEGVLAHLGVPAAVAAAPRDRGIKATVGPLVAAASALPSAEETPEPLAEEGFVGPKAAPGLGQVVVPDLSGLTARGAVRALAQSALEADLLGSGKTVAQSPIAGRVVSKGSKVSVRLEARL